MKLYEGTGESAMELLGFPRKMITSAEVIFQIAGKLLHFMSSIKLPFTLVMDLEHYSKWVNSLIFLKEESRTTYSTELTCQNQCVKNSTEELYITNLNLKLETKLKSIYV